MAVFICKMCGGHMELIGGNVCECKYCLTKQTVPGFEGEQAQNMVNRANHCRQQCDFDKALELYEKVLAKYGEDVDVFWSLALSRYGIEYVDDPVTKTKIPTCHRMQYVSILEDSDYLKAIQVAAPEQKAIIVSEARKIAEIQKRILEITRNERPFDIFICYKETDENGERTQDSVLAQNIYDALTREGYRVFFSRITLEGKLGVAYEPYIFSAINTSKIMIIVGTKPEYLESTWVKNEWGRYLQIVKKDSSKYIIPAYKGMSAYDLPDALAIYQSQDMSKIGAIQDLVHGVKKLMTPAKQENKGSDLKDMSTSFVKRAEMFLEESNWKSATEYCEKALNADPSNDMAYLFMLLIDLKLQKKEQLQGLRARFDQNMNYQRFMKVSVNEALKKEIKQYCNSVAQNVQNANLKESHMNALNLMKRTKSVSALEDAVRILEGMMPYVNVQEDLDKARALLVVAEKKARTGMLRALIVTACVIVSMIVIVFGGLYWLTKDFINGLVYTFQAEQLFSAGKYEDAIAKLEMVDAESMQGATDDHILQCTNAMNMEKARELSDGGDYTAAMELMQDMAKDYRDEDFFREIAMKCLENAEIGDTVYFGQEEFTVVEGKCIKPSYRFYEWEVLYNNYGELLLISKESFGEYIFTEDDEGEYYCDTHLEGSVLPGIKEYLTEEEKEMIIPTEIVEPDGWNYSLEFFLLSIEEYEGIMNGRTYKVGDGYVDCWTRSTVTDEETGMIRPIAVNKNGVSEVKEPSDMCHVCPAVWIAQPGYDGETAPEGEGADGEEAEGDE